MVELGIDLGTTNSALAVVEGGNPAIIRNNQGNQLTPSVVAYRADGTVEVGAPAENVERGEPERVVRSIKRHMGEHYTVEIDGEEYTPVDVSAEILSKLRAEAETRLDEVTGAVITVPAYFNDDQKQDTIAAAERAGFEDPALLNEPTAAAYAHGQVADVDGTVVVYDFGGGTLDVSVVDIDGTEYEVRNYNGDSDLGGDDFDRAIVDWIAADIEAEQGVDPWTDEEALANLLQLAEEAKKQLSSREEADLLANYVGEIDGQLISVDRTLTRDRFEELTEDLRERARKPLRTILSQEGLSSREIDHVLLVGGSTKMPAIRESVERVTKVEPENTLEPNEIVAKGAALEALKREVDVAIEHGGEDAGEEVLDRANIDKRALPNPTEIVPRSLGTKVSSGEFKVHIEKGTPYAEAEGSRRYVTVYDEQERMLIDAYQGESDVAADNYKLDEFRLTGIPSYPAGEAVVEVTFSIDEQTGTLYVEAEGVNFDASGQISIEQTTRQDVGT